MIVYCVWCEDENSLQHNNLLGIYSFRNTAEAEIEVFRDMGPFKELQLYITEEELDEAG